MFSLNWAALAGRVPGPDRVQLAAVDGNIVRPVREGALCTRLRRHKLDIQRQALSVEAGGLNHLDARREEREALVVRIKDLGETEENGQKKFLSSG